MKRFQTLLLCCLAHPVEADEISIGRLFFTPTERIALETTPTAGRPSMNMAMPSAIAVNGFVRRNDGKGTVWVNRQPIQESTAANNIEVGKLGMESSHVRIRLPGSGKAITLDAGQHYDPANEKLIGSIPVLTTSLGTSPDR